MDIYAYIGYLVERQALEDVHSDPEIREFFENYDFKVIEKNEDQTIL